MKRRPDGSDQESAHELIRQIQTQAKQYDNVKPKPQGSGRVKTGVLAAAVLSATLFLGWDLYHQEEATPPLTSAQLEASLEFTVYLTVAGLEEYRERTGALPATLTEAGLDDPALSYHIEPSGYRIEALSSQGALVFHEGDDLEPLVASYWDLQRRASE